MDYEEGAVLKIWSIITEYIHNDEVLYLKEVSKKSIRMQLRPNKTLRDFFRVDALCAEYSPLGMKELPNELKYHLSLLEESGDGLINWQWIKNKIGRLVEKFSQQNNHRQLIPNLPSLQPAKSCPKNVPLEMSSWRRKG